MTFPLISTRNAEAVYYPVLNNVVSSLTWSMLGILHPDSVTP